MAADITVIPYPANQKRGVNDLLRVDKKFRTYGPEDQKNEYHKRPHVEVVNSFLKTQYSMTMNKVRGLKQVASYALYSILCLILNREAAETFGRPDKAVSPTFFNTNFGTRQLASIPRQLTENFQRVISHEELTKPLKSPR